MYSCVSTCSFLIIIMDYEKKLHDLIQVKLKDDPKKNCIVDTHFVAFGIEFERSKHQGNKIGCIENT